MSGDVGRREGRGRNFPAELPGRPRVDEERAGHEVRRPAGHHRGHGRLRQRHRNKTKKTLTKKDIKKMTKEIKAKIKSGAELDESRRPSPRSTSSGSRLLPLFIWRS